MYIKLLHRNSKQNNVFFYFGKKATNTKERDFYKHYEYLLQSDAVPTGYFQNVLLHEGALNLHEILYHLQPLKLNYVIGIKPGMDFHKDWSVQLLDVIKDFTDTMMVTYNHTQDDPRPWSFFRGKSKQFYIFNPVLNHVFSEDDEEAWIEKSRANNYKYFISHENEFINLEEYGEELAKNWHFPKFEENYKQMYKFQTIDSYKDTIPVIHDTSMSWYEVCKNDPEISKQMYSKPAIGSDQKKELFQNKRKTLIYHSIYENELKNEFENFEEVVSFDHFDDLFTVFKEQKQDSVIYLGSLLSYRLFTSKMNYESAMAFTYSILSSPNSSIWARCFHTDQEIFIND